MKVILLMLLTTPLFAQDLWQEYIVGKPMPGFAEARAATAKEWGINYKAIFAGCIIDETVQKNMEKYEKSNQKYFVKLAKKFGKDWNSIFNFEARKNNLKSNDYLEGKWIDPVAGRPNQSYFEAKQKLAASWGINYEPLYLGCAIEDMSAEQQAQVEKENLYLTRLNSMLGENWKQHFDREFKKELHKKNPSISETLHEYLLEEVDEQYYQTKKTTLATWGINYEPHFVACCKNKEKKMKKGNYAEKAKAIETKMNTTFGAEWKKYLEIEIQKQL